ncbi:MAG: DUF84 family protein [Clostridia bacterium]|nr:DUF84 family protein [Clostridia bacterium]
MERKVISIVIATTSNDKIEGIKEAFLQYFPEDEFEIKLYTGKTESGVPDQPFGDETYQGAYNRINNIKEKHEAVLQEQGVHVDYYVSCEAGIDNTNRAIVRGKITPIYSSEQIVCIYNPESDAYSFGKSSSWTIPAEDIEEIKNTDLDKYLRKRGCTGLHDVGDGKYVTRKDAVREGTMSAIASSRFIERCERANSVTEKQTDDGFITAYTIEDK